MERYLNFSSGTSDKTDLIAQVLLSTGKVEKLKVHLSTVSKICNWEQKGHHSFVSVAHMTAPFLVIVHFFLF